MRLAFSIATAAVPEILILDEVLAVGDAAFQKKCHQRIGEIIESGATVLLVSHSIEKVQKLCRRVVWMEKGRVREDGPAEEVCGRYTAELEELAKKRAAARAGKAAAGTSPGTGAG